MWLFTPDSTVCAGCCHLQTQFIWSKVQGCYVLVGEKRDQLHPSLSGLDALHKKGNVTSICQDREHCTVLRMRPDSLRYHSHDIIDMNADSCLPEELQEVAGPRAHLYRCPI